MKVFVLLFLGAAYEVTAFSSDLGKVAHLSQRKMSQQHAALKYMDAIHEEEIGHMCKVLGLTDYSLVHANEGHSTIQANMHLKKHSSTSSFPSLSGSADVYDKRAAIRASLAAEFVRNDGFSNPIGRRDLLADDDFVFCGPVVGPLNKRDYLGTVGIFKIYEAFPDRVVYASPSTQDPEDPNRFWSFIRVTGTHTGELNIGSMKIPPTYKGLAGGPQAVSVTFDENDKIIKYTAGYVTDAKDGKTGMLGAMFMVMKSIGQPLPRPGGKTANFLNWVGAKMVDFPKGRSHALDLPEKWAEQGRKHGKRTADAWTKDF